MSMRIYNTLTRDTEDFVPLDGNHVRLYTCGPTIYNFAHIGNFRAYMFEDILRRHLKWSGYDITQVMNLTDVDDKTIKASREAGISLTEYTRTYTDSFFEDLDILGIERAEHYPAATTHVAEMIELVGLIMERGYGYKSDDGSVYFDVGKFEGYGKLARIDMGGQRAGARVAQDEYDKENVADFALWKAWDENDGDVVWDSPWGKGRPGWHIECSAMSMKYLGKSFDIHTGGIDNMFPHHENEIAQSEAATGEPFVKYWMHCGHLVVDGKKMAKSLGNFYTLRDILDRGYSGREVRYVLLGAQYRQPLNFTFQALDAARSSLKRLDEFRDRARDLAGPEPAGAAPAWAETGVADFRGALDDDLNMPEALGALFDMVHAGNKAMDAGDTSGAEAGGVLRILDEIDSVLGVLKKAEDKPDHAAEALLASREKARAAKDWAEADRMRDELAMLGWQVHDTPEGPRLKRS